jgi:hypothetical protein
MTGPARTHRGHGSAKGGLWWSGHGSRKVSGGGGPGNEADDAEGPQSKRVGRGLVQVRRRSGRLEWRRAGSGGSCNARLCAHGACARRERNTNLAASGARLASIQCGKLTGWSTTCRCKQLNNNTPCTAKQGLLRVWRGHMRRTSS